MADKLKWTNDRRTLGDLLPRERNPRRIAQPEAERLVDSYEEFDQAEVILIGPENQLYNGHQRLKVWAEQYGPDLEVKVYISNTNKAASDFGWRPKVGIEEGLSRMVEWVKTTSAIAAF